MVMPLCRVRCVWSCAVLAAAVCALIVTAGCIAPASTAVDPSEVVEILDYEVTPLGHYSVGVEGHVRNNYDEKFTAIGIAVKFYDSDGIMIGDGRTIIENLDPGETALFTIRYYGDGYPESAKISEIRVRV
jgi:hypothetical protein